MAICALPYKQLTFINASEGNDTVEHTNVIELNGKRYDAVTGKYLGVSHSKPIPAAPSPQGRTIDGVVRSTARPHAAPILDNHAKKAVARPKTQNPRQHTPKHAPAHQPQHAKTLMRHAVSKPKAIAKPLKAKGLAPAPNHTLAVKESVSKINPHRQQRANLAARHHDIRRFQAQASRPNMAPASVGRDTHQHPPVRAAAATAIPARSDHNAMFEAAIAHATSHEQPAPRLKKHHRKSHLLVHASIAIVLVLAIGGIVGWTQWGQIQLQIASWQVGFDGRMPGYALTDYKRSEIRQEHGSIVMTYQSGDRHYQLTQQESSWNSQTLLDQGVAGASTEETETIESKGRTIYITGSNASWVDGGVRYDITGNAPLTTDDITAIVDSM